MVCALLRSALLYWAIHYIITVNSNLLYDKFSLHQLLTHLSMEVDIISSNCPFVFLSHIITILVLINLHLFLYPFQGVSSSAIDRALQVKQCILTRQPIQALATLDKNLMLGEKKVRRQNDLYCKKRIPTTTEIFEFDSDFEFEIWMYWNLEKCKLVYFINVFLRIIYTGNYLFLK